MRTSRRTASAAQVDAGTFVMTHDQRWTPAEKIAVVPDSTDKATFIITNEDHTLGNALRYMLIRK